MEYDSNPRRSRSCSEYCRASRTRSASRFVRAATMASSIPSRSSRTSAPSERARSASSLARERSARFRAAAAAPRLSSAARARRRSSIAAKLPPGDTALRPAREDRARAYFGVVVVARSHGNLECFLVGPARIRTTRCDCRAQLGQCRMSRRIVTFDLLNGVLCIPNGRVFESRVREHDPRLGGARTGRMFEPSACPIGLTSACGSEPEQTANLVVRASVGVELVF